MCVCICVIPQSDMHTKHAEFTLWAIDVKKTNPEHLGRLEEKELFKDYMEDFNTGVYVCVCVCVC